MTKYIVHIYREMRLTFEGIEADTPEAAAAVARDKLTDDADDIEDCNGESLSALIDVAGDDQYEQSVDIDFEAERQRKAAPALLAALIQAEVLIAADIIRDDAGCLANIRAAVAEAKAAGIPSGPTAPRLLDALQAVLPYAWNERASLRECWERDDDPKVKEELEACDRALAQATAAVAEAKAAGILPATGGRPNRFRFTHEPEENPDRAYVLVDGSFDVKIVRTAEGIVIDVYSKDGTDVVGTMIVWDEEVAEPEHEASEGAVQP
jgi:hypothetical protein